MTAPSVTPMKDKIALSALLERVEAGRFPETWHDIANAGVSVGSFGNAKSGYAWLAFNGSLNGAKMLHNILLSGWTWGCSERKDGPAMATVYHPDGRQSHRSYNDDPARAWLIAIIRALIATPDTEGR